MKLGELNPDYDISMHELDVCVGDNQYRLMYYVYVQHKESGIGVYGDKDFDMQEVINRLPIKFTIEKEHSIIPKGVHIKSATSPVAEESFSLVTLITILKTIQ